MKISGILLVILGIILGIIAVTMDITGGHSVVNLGLMNDRSNLTIGAGIAFISGIILIGFGSFNSTKSEDNKKCPHCAEMIKREATICRYCNKEQSIESCVPVETIDEITRIKQFSFQIFTRIKQFSLFMWFLEWHKSLSKSKALFIKIVFIVLAITFLEYFWFSPADMWNPASEIAWVFEWVATFVTILMFWLLFNLLDTLIYGRYPIPSGLKGNVIRISLIITTVAFLYYCLDYLETHNWANTIIAYISLISITIGTSFLLWLWFDLFDSLISKWYIHPVNVKANAIRASLLCLLIMVFGPFRVLFTIEIIIGVSFLFWFSRDCFLPLYRYLFSKFVKIKHDT